MTGRNESWPVIGDLVSSRGHSDRLRLQQVLLEVLSESNNDPSIVQTWEPTLGDEFQAIFASLGSALRATLQVRLELCARPGGADVRFGIGRGTIQVLDRQRSPVSQDGPGWWTARAAIERAKLLASTPRTNFVRTCYVPALDPKTRAPEEAAEVQAFLICRDALLAQMKPRDHILLLGLLRELNQDELGAQLGITQSAVSQALRRSGAYAVAVAQATMDQV
jgi:hypothetical protein